MEDELVHYNACVCVVCACTSIFRPYVERTFWESEYTLAGPHTLK